MGYTPFVPPANRPDDIRPPAFSVGEGSHSQQVFSQQDLYTPAEMVQVFERHSRPISYRMMMKLYGFTRGASTPTVGHYEYPWYKDLVRVGSIVTASAGAGNNMVIELDADSMFDPGATASGTTIKGSYPVVGDLIMLPDGNKAQIIAKDVSTDPHRLTLRPVKSTVDLDGSVTAGENYFISDSAFGEGTGLPSGRTSRIMKYTNDFQIIKQAAITSGSELTNQAYFEPIPGTTGSFVLRVQWETMQRFEDQCDGALIFGSSIDNITTLSSQLGVDVTVKGTEGLIEFARVNGYTVNYTPGSYTTQDFDGIARIYELERIGVKEIAGWQGIDIYQEQENALQALLNGDLTANLAANRFTFSMEPNDAHQLVDSGDFALRIGFQAVRKSGYNFSWKSLHTFNEAIGAGAEDYNYTQWSIWTPLGYTKNKATGGTAGTVGYEYKVLNGYSREQVVANINGVGVAGSGGLSPVAVNQYDISTIGMLSEIASHNTCANHIILQTP
jgi:hypothetical protein